MIDQHHTEVSVKGRRLRVPAVQVAGKTVVVTGRFIRIAQIHDEAYTDADAALDPGEVRRELASIGQAADLFTFSQRVGDEEPRYGYLYEWDNAAALSSKDYNQWWKALSEATRRNVRLASRRGVTVTVAKFDDAFVEGIKAIYDETPIRQGRRFWHYGKDLDTVRNENSSFLSRSEFLGAYCGGQLIGFMKFVYVGQLALIMQILASSSHRDRKPMNAMIAKAVEICERKGMSHLVYCKFNYGNKKDDSVAEFKRRNGFVEVRFPQYFVPLTARGRIALALRLHRGALGLLPAGVIRVMLRLRSGLAHIVGVLRTGRGRSSAKTAS